MENNSNKTETQKERFMETVLVMQGGGSLGAYECGVYKTLVKHNIEFDIVSGTSIGALNAAIIASHTHHDIEKSSLKLENFWLELGENILPSSLRPYVADGLRAIIASLYSATYGNSKAFFPKWITPSFFYYPQSLSSLHYPLFDIAPLKKTLSHYVDFTTLRNHDNPRLIVTCTDIQTSKPVIFDSKYYEIDIDKVIASACLPFYGISWTKVDNKYLWDGALLSNTPLREVIDVSPISDKIVYLVNVFPTVQKDIPQDIVGAWHRARDIIYSDKTENSLRLSTTISRYLSLLREMHDLLLISDIKIKGNNDAKLKDRLDKMEMEYDEIACQRGAIIKEIVRIQRQEKIHFLFEDADFSIKTIKELIKQGEADAQRALSAHEH